MFKQKKVGREFIPDYLDFCANPLRGEAEILRECEILKNHPRVKYLAFSKSNVLMVGTDEIIITHKGKRYLIGEFIIFIGRKEVAGYWEVNFSFMNITNPIIKRSDDFYNEAFSELRMHPHIATLHGSDRHMIGKLCISRGQFPVFQYLRQAKIHLAVPRLIEILEVYPTGSPYTSVENWPVLGEEDG